MKVDYSKYIDKVKFWKKTIEAAKSFTGTSPPSMFIGKAFYPKVFVGILSPPQHQDNAEVLDSPETWYKQKANIQQILNYRGQMIYSRFVSPVKMPEGKLIDAVQEVSMSKNPADVEIELEKQPRFRMVFDSYAQPVGSPADAQKMRLTENPHVESKVDNIISDTDFNAHGAVSELFKHGIQVSRIQKIFSAGLLGKKIQRKLVPTRWSITAVDDLVGKSIMEKVKDYQEISEYMLFSNEYLGNHYEILLIPGKWRFEIMETVTQNQNIQEPVIYSDWENYLGRKDYAKEVSGGYYSVRLSVLEFLDKIKKQASCLVLREINKEAYDIPLGVWVVRETCRGAFNKQYYTFDNFNSALDAIFIKMSMDKSFWLKKSKLITNVKNQKSIKEYFI